MNIRVSFNFILFFRISHGARSQTDSKNAVTVQAVQASLKIASEKKKEEAKSSAFTKFTYRTGKNTKANCRRGSLPFCRITAALSERVLFTNFHIMSKIKFIRKVLQGLNLLTENCNAELQCGDNRTDMLDAQNFLQQSRDRDTEAATAYFIKPAEYKQVTGDIKFKLNKYLKLC